MSSRESLYEQVATNLDKIQQYDADFRRNLTAQQVTQLQEASTLLRQVPKLLRSIEALATGDHHAMHSDRTKAIELVIKEILT